MYGETVFLHMSIIVTTGLRSNDGYARQRVAGHHGSVQIADAESSRVQ
jgi:hypothetical protein